MSALLSIEHLSVNYGDIPVLRDISLNVGAGQILGIVGESGCGKSTAIYSAMGILGNGGHIVGGDIFFQGLSLSSLSAEAFRRLRGRSMALIAQDPVKAFHPIRRIGSQLHEFIRSHKGLTCEEADLRILELFRYMNLKEGKDLLRRYAFELSGGMCQRVAIAMSMVLRPQLLFADEPTSALDVIVQAKVIRALMEIRERFKTSIVIVSHNMGVVSRMADQIIVMHGGVIVEQGEKKTVLGHPRHIYTRNLIRAIPRRHAAAAHGVQDFDNNDEGCGCPFEAGCAKRSRHCLERMPALREIERGHWVRCRNCQGGI